MPAKTRRPRPRRGAMPPARAAAIAHAHWLVEHLRGLGRALARLPGAIGAPSWSPRRHAQTAASAHAEPTTAATTHAADPADPSASPRRTRAAALAAEIADRARAASPRLRQRAALARHGLTRLSARLLGGLTAALLALGRGLVRHHRVLLGLVHRLMWWGSLALLVVGGRIAIDPHGPHPLAEAVPFFVGGFALCAFAILLAAAPRIRLAAFALGVSHAGLALLLWALTQG